MSQKTEETEDHRDPIREIEDVNVGRTQVKLEQIEDAPKHGEGQQLVKEEPKVDDEAPKQQEVKVPMKKNSPSIRRHKLEKCKTKRASENRVE